MVFALWMVRESTMEHRYNQLHLHAALSRRCDYPQACQELAYILRRLYTEAPKGVQLTMYQDVLSAFRLLPGMDTIQQLSAADVLLHAVEVTLPKKRRAAAVSEYKQAAVAQHRRARHEELVDNLGDCSQLSTDVLLHIFGFLNPHSLAMSSAVCRTWNEASNDDRLWRTHFLSLFHVSKFGQEPMSLNAMTECGVLDHHSESRREAGAVQRFWRIAFSKKLSKPGRLSLLIISNRALCTGCTTPFWLSEPPAIQENGKNCKHQHHTARPITVEQVLFFILTEPSSSSSSSSSDDDEDFMLQWQNFSRMWAYPRRG